MTFDPDRPDAHAESRGTRTEPAPAKSRRPAATDAEARALERLPALTLSGWDATFTESVLAAVAKYGPSLTEAQWRHVARIGYAKPAPPTPRSPIEAEMDEVEAQLDALLADPHGDRCALANDEAGMGRGKSIDRALGLGPGGDGPLATTARLPEYGFGQCQDCFIGPSRACPRCAAGTPHPGESCADGRRNRVCKGIAFLATLRARALDAAGRHDDSAAIRVDMGLEAKT